MSRPPSWRTPPWTSDTATTVQPRAAASRATHEPDVAEPLDGEALAGEVEAPALGVGLEHVDHPPPGGRLAPGAPPRSTGFPVTMAGVYP